MARTVSQRRNTPRTITVELTEGEADFLLGVTSIVGGDKSRSMRKYSDRLRRTLSRSLGYGPDDTDFVKYGRGHVYMNRFDGNAKQRDRMAYLLQNELSTAEAKKLDAPKRSLQDVLNTYRDPTFATSADDLRAAEGLGPAATVYDYVPEATSEITLPEGESETTLFATDNFGDAEDGGVWSTVSRFLRNL